MPSRHAYTLRDVIAVVCVVTIIGTMLAVVVLRNRVEARQQMEGNQLRLVHQGLITWAQHGSDDYPTPSRVDRLDFTVPESGRAKDTTANIFSMLVSLRSVTPEQLISPFERNQSIKPAINYEYSSPHAAVKPEQAIWDPKFSAVLDGSRVGNLSYAHLQPAGERRARWSNTFSASQIALSNRGPEIASASINPDNSVTPTFALPSSNTLRFYGRGQTWSGWAAFNDNHVEFRRDYLKSGRPLSVSTATFTPPYTNSAGKRLPDLFTYDEPDDPNAANDYIGIFLKAGNTPADFKAAWD